LAERKLTSAWDLRDYSVSRERLFSATHAEILNGWTTDIYFAKSLDVLRYLRLDGKLVAAEVFANRAGVLCGVKEALYLLSGKDVEVWALSEGERFAEKEVILQIRGPYAAYGLYETALLGILASSSGWATAAAACKEAAGPKPVISFGARHIHPAVAPVMERAAIIGGADGASCVLGAKLAGREPMGTLPHACFLVVGDTVEVARAYPEAMPPDTPVIILVDTFKDEVEETLRVARALEDRLFGVRLDTPSERGRVTPELVQEVKAYLKMAGFGGVQIVVSGGLNPDRIAELAAAGADVFGVGSYIAAATPIDMTMDVKEVDGRPVAKRGRIPGLTPSPRLKRLL
jgi:nicotinate phosphoribosyltransferase